MGKCYKGVSWFVVLGALLVAGCALRTPTPLEPFAAEDLNPRLRAGQYSQKTENFVVILDASGSMAESYKGQAKLDLAKNFANRMNETIPEIKLKGGLRQLSGTHNPFAEKSVLVYGLSDFGKTNFKGALNSVVSPAGDTPLALAIERAGEDVQTLQGRIAAIIVSDGKETEGDALSAARKMKQRLGDRLCIYPVIVGDDAQGRKNMDEIAKAGSCGFSIPEETTRTSLAAASFVENVFLAKVGDQDGDGVLDPADRCPNTPRGVRVDARGCPVPAQTAEAPKAVAAAPRVMDSDGDGVLDNADLCPKTPRGAQVDERGCWALVGVKFDIDKWEIKPGFYPLLDKVAEVLERNPNLKVQIQGHTDSTGTPKYNQGLSEKRARAVAEYLNRKGIPKQRLEPEGFGLTEPIATNGTREGRAENRRVQFKPDEQ